MRVHRLSLVLLFALFCVPASAQISVNCTEQRLTGAQRITCETPELMQLGKDIDQLTAELERRLTGKNKEALLDTKGLLVVERNACQNSTPIRDCVQTLLTQRDKAKRYTLVVCGANRSRLQIWRWDVLSLLEGTE